MTQKLEWNEKLALDVLPDIWVGFSKSGVKYSCSVSLMKTGKHVELKPHILTGFAWTMTIAEYVKWLNIGEPIPVI